MNKLETFLFGKKFMKKNKSHQIKLLKTYVILLFFVINFSVFVLLFIAISSFIDIRAYKSIMHPELVNETQIIFDGLTLQEQKNIKNMIMEINPLYSKLQHNITFTKNISKYYLKEQLNGFNDGKGNSVIQYRDDLIATKITLCHELLHSYFKLDEASHDIIYSLSRKLVCYDKEDKIYFNLK